MRIRPPPPSLRGSAQQVDQNHGHSDNPYTGQAQEGCDRTVNTPTGTTGNVARGQSYNTETGQTNTYGTPAAGNDHYADANGNVYKSTDSGWQQHTSNGWQSAGNADSAWADREQQARSQSESRFSSFGGGRR